MSSRATQSAHTVAINYNLGFPRATQSAHIVSVMKGLPRATQSAHNVSVMNSILCECICHNVPLKELFAKKQMASNILLAYVENYVRRPL